MGTLPPGGERPVRPLILSEAQGVGKGSATSRRAFGLTTTSHPAALDLTRRRPNPRKTKRGAVRKDDPSLRTAPPGLFSRPLPGLTLTGRTCGTRARIDRCKGENGAVAAAVVPAGRPAQPAGVEAEFTK